MKKQYLIYSLILFILAILVLILALSINNIQSGFVFLVAIILMLFSLSCLFKAVGWEKLAETITNFGDF